MSRCGVPPGRTARRQRPQDQRPITGPCGGRDLGQAALAQGKQQRRLCQAPALERPLPEAVPAGPVPGGGRIEADRSGARPEEGGGRARVDDRPRPRVCGPFSRCSAASRAARAQRRSVSASVRTRAGRGSPRRSRRSRRRARSRRASASSAVRRPVVEPSETISTSRAPAAPISGDGPVHLLGAARFETGRPQQGHRLQRRRAPDVEAGPVALLDRRHGRILAAPGERPDDRETRRDTRDLGREEGKPTREEGEQRPAARGG